MARLALVRCPDYRPSSVGPAVDEALGLLGGLEAFVRRTSRVFVKINHLSPPSPPEAGIVTHPAFAAAVLERLKEAGAEVVVGDDVNSRDGDPFGLSGYREVCRRLGIRLADLKEDGFRKVLLRGRRVGSAFYSGLVLEAEVVINLPKFKTHSFTVLTGAVKNMFGCLPHGRRLEAHRRFPDQGDFSEMLVDIYGCRLPSLTLMDAVVVMEGEGPAAGKLRPAGLVLASADGVAVDAAAAALAGFDPDDVPTNAAAGGRGFGVSDLGRVEVVGQRLADAFLPAFKPSGVASGLLRKKIPAALYAYVSGQLAFVPRIRKDLCNGCGECLRSCPTGAARQDGSQARVERSACIGCMCCHEVCRFGAIRLERKPVGRGLVAAGRAARRLGFRV